MVKEQRKIIIRFYGQNNRLMNEGTVVSHIRLKTLQDHVRSNFKLSHCEVLLPDGERYRICDQHIEQQKGKFFLPIKNKGKNISM